MKKKNLILTIVIFSIILLIGTISNAEDEEKNMTTLTTSTGIKANITYELDSDGKIINLRCTNAKELAGKLTIPSKINEKDVISLGNGAFQSSSSLIEVELPETIKSIGSSAFRECTGLAKITIPNGILTIGNNAFYNCKALAKIEIPDTVVDIGEYAFWSCRNLSSVKLSNKLSVIKNNTFGYTELKKVEIPDGVSTIGEEAFRYVKNLEILIPDSVISISKSTFVSGKVIIYATKTSYAYKYVNEKLYDSSSTLIFEDSSKWNESKKVGPTVKSIEVSSPTSGTYNTSQTVKIRVYFSDKITGTSVPTLKIKFGDNQERSVENGTISQNYIEYSYNIQTGDNGQLVTVDLSGGKIKDDKGNDAILSCPIISGNTIKANTKGTITNNTDNQDKTNNNSNPTTGTNGSESKTENNSGSNITQNPATSTPTYSKDSTIATSKLPNTGKGIILLIAIVLIILTGAIAKVKYNSYKDIK